MSTGEPRGVVAITGASGYLGGVIKRRCEADGWTTVDLVRTPRSDADRRFVIGAPLEPNLLDGVDALIHCAYDMTLTSEEDIWKINVRGSKQLLDLATNVGCDRVIVLSSMSAYEGTTQLYGRSKLAIEEASRMVGAVSVRPGLVYGPNAGGMAGALSKAGALPVIPVPASQSYQFTVHEDDFADAIVALLEAKDPGVEPIGIANPTPVRFSKVIKGLVRAKGATVRTVPVSWRLVHSVLQTLEKFPVALPFRSDSLYGLANPAPSVPNLEVLAGLNVTLRRFEQPTLP